MGRRSIPARAGEPPSAADLKTRSKVYPRACGGTHGGCADVVNVGGLSPRVRGNRHIARRAQRLHGSIPARAGEPGCAAPATCTRGVYPRACGGTFSAVVTTATMAGLSPRVRGNLIADVDDGAQCGSIPARAGEPVVLKSFNRALKVYPRACGGTHRHRSATTSSTGLSPRVRGNLGAGSP